MGLFDLLFNVLVQLNDVLTFCFHIEHKDVATIVWRFKLFNLIGGFVQEMTKINIIEVFTKFFK